MDFCNKCHCTQPCCPICHCCGCCCCCPPCPPPNPASFSVIKRDSVTGQPVSGAEFTLFQNGAPVYTAVSDSRGTLSFRGLGPGSYELSETAAPDGYAQNTQRFTVIVDACGAVTINGVTTGWFSIYNAPLSRFIFPKTGAGSRPLPGAVFTLSNGSTAVSGADGTVDFGALLPGTYTLTETAAPNGYLPDPQAYQVTVSAVNEITINGIPLEEFSVSNTRSAGLSFLKYDEATGLPLPGAVFTLSNGLTVTSDAAGAVDFGSLALGSYTMVETTAPNGYLSNNHSYLVVVSQTGEITVDGVPLEDFNVQNIRRPDFLFPKYDADTGLPLANATFTLSNGTTATSNAEGVVDFGSLAPGTYIMSETSAPEGYETNPATYLIEVAQDGTITVDGAPLANFSVSDAPIRSPRPVIDSVTEGDSFIHGEGVPGASISVTLPDGTRIDTTVNDNGIWLVPVPSGITLQAGQTIYANQTVPGSAPSENASFLVQPGV